MNTAANVLRSISGISQKEAWIKVSDELHANFVKGGFWRSNKVIANISTWTITLDTFAVHAGKVTVVYTRMRAPYFSKDGFRFKIYNQTIFSSLGKFFGMQDIEIGVEHFDKKYVIQSHDEYKVKKLFANDVVRQLIEVQPKIELQVKDDEGWLGTKFPSDVDELYFAVPGVIKDVERLKSLFGLFTTVLDQLCAIGSASERNPRIELK